MKTACFIFIVFSNSLPLLADCQGCCSYHGGVVCEGGITSCADGTPLSSTCAAKGCDACESNSGGSTGSGETPAIEVPPPVFLDASYFWFDDLNDLYGFFPDPGSDGFRPGNGPMWYVVTLWTGCVKISGYFRLPVNQDEEEPWPLIKRFSNSSLSNPNLEIEICRVYETNGLRIKSERVLIASPSVDRPRPPGVDVNTRDFHRWLLHLPKLASGFKGTVKLSNPDANLTTAVSFFGFSSSGEFLVRETIQLGASETKYLEAFQPGAAGLFADFEDQISHIGIWESPGLTRISLAVASVSTRYRAWLPEVDLRKGFQSGTVFEVEGRENPVYLDGVALLNLSNSETISLFVSLIAPDTGVTMEEVSLGQIQPGSKKLSVLSEVFPDKQGNYRFKSSPPLPFQIVGFTFAGAEFFSPVLIQKK